MATNLPLWMGEVPNYDIINGNMHISMGEFVVAMPINVFLVGCVRGKNAIVQWERSHKDAEVVRFPAPAKH